MVKYPGADKKARNGLLDSISDLIDQEFDGHMVQHDSYVMWVALKQESSVSRTKS